MKKNFHVIRLLIVFLFGLVSLRVSNVYSIEPLTFEEWQLIESLLDDKGKQIQFSDSNNSERERAIVYDITKMAESESEKYNPGSSKARIGIALEDLDDDGNNEILAYIEHIDWCGTGGCTLFVAKKDKDGYWKKFLNMGADPPVIMMNTTWHGYHDFAFVEKGYKEGMLSKTIRYIMRFDGEKYIDYAKRETIYNEDSKNTKIITYRWLGNSWEIIYDK